MIEWPLADQTIENREKLQFSTEFCLIRFDLFFRRHIWVYILYATHTIIISLFPSNIHEYYQLGDAELGAFPTALQNMPSKKAYYLYLAYVHITIWLGLFEMWFRLCVYVCICNISGFYFDISWIKCFVNETGKRSTLKPSCKSCLTCMQQNNNSLFCGKFFLNNNKKVAKFSYTNF